MMKRILALAFLLIATPAMAAIGDCGGTISPGIPSTNAPLVSSVIRGQFQAARADIGAVQNMTAALTPPAAPCLWEIWADTNTTPPTLKQWNGTTWAFLAKAGTTIITTGSIVGDAPIIVSIVDGVATISLDTSAIPTLSGANVWTNSNSFTSVTKFSSEVWLNGTAGVSGQIPVSSGTGLSPVWANITSRFSAGQGLAITGTTTATFDCNTASATVWGCIKLDQPDTVATHVALGTGSFGPVPAATLYTAGGTPAITGNATDCYLGTGAFATCPGGGGGMTYIGNTQYDTAGSFTYTVPVGANVLYVKSCNSGGGGSSGSAQYTTLGSGLTTPGAPGVCSTRLIPVSIISGPTVPITIAAGGAGGNGATVTWSTSFSVGNYNPGTPGSPSFFGNPGDMNFLSSNSIGFGSAGDYAFCGGGGAGGQVGASPGYAYTPPVRGASPIGAWWALPSSNAEGLGGDGADATIYGGGGAGGVVAYDPNNGGNGGKGLKCGGGGAGGDYWNASAGTGKPGSGGDGGDGVVSIDAYQ